MQYKPNITLSTGRIVAHRPCLSNGAPNGATEAYLIDGDVMTDAEWKEYVKLSTPIHREKKLSWAEIKTNKG